MASPIFTVVNVSPFLFTILKNPPILIMDEATNGLDEKSELKIIKEIHNKNPAQNKHEIHSKTHVQHTHMQPIVNIMYTTNTTSICYIKTHVQHPHKHHITNHAQNTYKNHIKHNKN